MIARAIGQLDTPHEASGAAVEKVQIAAMRASIDRGDPQAIAIHLQSLNVEQFAIQRQRADEARAFDRAVMAL